MKLLYVSDGYTTHDYRFLQAFRAAGWEVSHLCLTENSTENRPLPNGVRSILWEKPAGITPSHCSRYRELLEQVLKEEQPDVVLAGPVPTVAYLVALTGFRRFVAMSWGSDVLVDVRDNPSARKAACFALVRAAGVFGDCEAVAQTVRALASPPPDRLLIFPWGIDVIRFAPGQSSLDLRQRLGWQEKRVLICIRSWERMYGIDILLRAMENIVPLYPEARLLLVGDGSLRAEIFALIDRLGLREKVHTAGRIRYDDLPEYLRLADLYVSAALSDGTSVSLLEAMACGLPVVVTEGYGNAEWVRPGENGWLAKAGDVQSLSSALQEALACPPSRIAGMHSANRAVTRARADWSKNFPRLLHLLGEVARG